MSDKTTIRHFEQKDVSKLLIMMKHLATFERYIDDFKVTEDYLSAHGLGENKQFYVLVAEVSGELVGYACYYFIPFTYHLKSKMILKELFISDKARGLGLGGQLFEALESEAQNADCCLLEWTVLPENAAAQSFYQKHGGAYNDKWQIWSVNC
ncbi:MAG: GNAT family N-acetyltransferase [Alphaproteobacteria bacterium]|nr:GNAT family N-acetyltransferase [Alphaproteobacteria bacterium]